MKIWRHAELVARRVEQRQEVGRLVASGATIQQLMKRFRFLARSPHAKRKAARA